ncbi:MAG: hypothetical protein PWP04_410 [Candidatus Atribacteria bacterium]|nr:hypothetical protein [Candidatus Atribacteria bacterium]
MIIYLDTSALVKLYVEESGSQRVREEIEKVEVVATSRIAYVEARAGFSRKLREGELKKREYRQVVEDFERDWVNYFIMEVSEDVARLGGSLTEDYPLRGFDALHLASALILQNRVRSGVYFLCFDEQLKRAAQAEGLQE